MAYYVNYNDIDLTDKIKVREVNTTLTPPRENSTINIFERAGEIYNGYRWNNREITLSFLLLYTEEEYDNNPLILEQGLADMASCFNVDSPKPLYLNNPDKFIYAIPEGDIEVNELRYNCAEITVNFVCYDPFYYSEEAKQYDGTNMITIQNEGDVPTDPVIMIGIDEDCHFVQVENTANHKKMLIGNFPVVSKSSVAEKSNAIVDECDSTSGWSTSTTSIDGDRTNGGTLAMTSTGTGIMCGNFGSAGSTTWHGVSARKNLGTNIKNFQVEAYITNTSTGVNGDPHTTVDMTNPEVKYSTVKGYKEVQVTSGSREEYYEVICTSLWKRKGPSTSYETCGYWKKGDKIYPKNFTGHKGLWGEVAKGVWSYCDPAYVQKKVKDTTVVKTVKQETSTTVTTYLKNYYTTSTAEVREWPKSKDSKLVCTLPAGQIVRVKDSKIYEDENNYWYALESAMNGNGRYVKGNNISLANNVSIEYPVEPETADDKTGIIELYGYDVNGVQLFKLSLTDDNEWYEFNYPLATIGGKQFLKDNNVAPAPKTSSENKVSDNKLTVTKDYMLSGKYGNWNDFYGKLGIKRVNDVWQVWFVKMQSGNVVKQMWSNSQKVTGAPTGNLSYITLYIGTSGDKPSGMSLEKLEVKNLTPVDPVVNNPKKFQKGDVLKIDCYNNRVWLNDKLYNNVEIGSQFFPLEVGENVIKITSDKGTTNTVIFNEKYL